MGLTLQVRGKPAKFAKIKRNNILKYYFFYIGLFILSSFLTLYVLLNLYSTMHYLAVAVGAVICIFIFFKIRKANVDLAKLTAGISAEELVVKVLKKTKYSFLINGAIIGKIGDIDHIVLDPACAIIETKYGKGKVYIKDNILYVNNKQLVKDPIKQVKMQASLFSSIYKTPTNAVICVSEGDFRPFTYSGVVLCNAKDLPSVLNKLPHSVSFNTSLEITQNIPVA
jgi:Holliday junction resolvase-like predicted endonuclease